MSKTLLADVDGFVPTPDLLIRRYGIVTAIVWGRIWRYCQMEHGVCQASLETIAGELNLNKSTVMRHIERLVRDEFLVDKTPDLRNRPHTYADTGKVALYDKFGVGVAESNSSVVQNNSGVAESNAGVAESDLKIDLKRDSKKESKRGGAGNRAPEPRPEATDFPDLVLYRQVTSAYPPKGSWHSVLVFTQAVRARLGRDPTPDDLQPFYSAWCDRGYNPRAVTWMEWAGAGTIPERQRSGHATNPGPPHETSESDREAARRVLERQRARRSV